MATVRVTGIFTGLLLAPADTIETVPVYIPGAKVVGCTVTPRVSGVVPPTLLMNSHLPPNAVDADVVKLVFPPDTENVWEFGVGNPCS